MRRELNRTCAASVLVLAAVAFPVVSWYISGSHDVAREMARIESEPQRAIQETAQRLADRLTERLETLRTSEADRPFYHYQNLYHDPQGASEGLSVTPSPLAQGPKDALIEAYFQVDPSGKLTLPTLNDEVPELQAQAQVTGQHKIKQRLEPWAEKLRAAPQRYAANDPPAQQAGQVQVLEPEAYAQNVAADEVYRDIKGGRARELSSNLLKRRNEAAQQADVVVRVGGLEWQTLSIDNVPSLVAVREVVTPDGPRTQGFVVATAAAERWLGDSRAANSLVSLLASETRAYNAANFPMRLLPGEPTGPGEAALGLAGVAWKIACDPGNLLNAARTEARRVRTQFRQRFVMGAGAATFAGLCLVLIVWQTDRTARQRSQFAAAAAHELRTPLAGLRMYSEMLAEGLGDPSKATDYARRIANEAARLGRVVSNMLGFTRLERGTLNVRTSEGDLAEVVRECVHRQEPALQAAGARLNLSVPADLPAVRFDRDAVCEILQNLIDNAEKHSRAAEDRTIEVSVSLQATTVILSVADRGPGIPAVLRRRLFRPFERGNHPDAPAGLGLGLVLVQALVQAHRGTVRYDDRPGGGAVFTVSLPR